MQTTGELRKMLAQTIESVRDGKLSLEKAGAIQKIAGRINESIYAEAKIVSMLGKKDVALGSLEIHS
jgi:hypothetical protein